MDTIKNNVNADFAEVIDYYGEAKKTTDNAKKESDKLNKKLKIMFKDMNIEDAQGEKYKATFSISERTSFNDEKLIALVKKYPKLDLIKTREYVDMDALEAAIYNGSINPVELSPCEVITKVETLRIKKL